MRKKRPHIGVTGPDRGGTAAWLFTKWAVFVSGGKAIRIRPGNEKPAAKLHGLILGGGADIDPQYYGGHIPNDPPDDLQSETTTLRRVLHLLLNILLYPLIFLVRAIFSTKSTDQSTKRDEMEFQLLRQALEEGWPVMGICRGAQLINIHLGGSLHEDIARFYTEVPYHYTIWPRKKVKIEGQSRLSEWIPFSHIWVNALHHQAIDRRGTDIRVAAREKNGIIQAIESKSRPFLLGVQWHPEYMPQIPAQRQLFEVLVGHAQTFMEDSTPFRDGNQQADKRDT